MSAIKEIGEALSYDACEVAIMKRGNFANVLRLAAMIADLESDPVSVRVHNDAKGDAATIAPKGK